MLKTFDLFSGIGGFALGLEATGGFATSGFCEIRPPCRKLLAHHWPEVPCHDDVTTITADDVGAVDVVCGGFPCQDISLAGNGAGLDGDRSVLWFEIPRLLRALRAAGTPVRYVILENVSALLARGFDRVLRDLASCGLDAEWDCIPASAVRAPHQRDRVWLVAYARGIEHEGFGDAFRRALAAQLFTPHAKGGGDGCDGNGSVEVAREVGDELADTEGLGVWAGFREDEPGRERWGRLGDGGGEGGGRRAGDGGGAFIPDAGGTGLSLSEREYLRREGWREERRAVTERRWWGSEPDVGRVAYGVPARVDRLHGLGNAVVPAIPFILGQAILAARAELGID